MHHITASKLHVTCAFYYLQAIPPINTLSHVSNTHHSKQMFYSKYHLAKSHSNSVVIYYLEELQIITLLKHIYKNKEDLYSQTAITVIMQEAVGEISTPRVHILNNYIVFCGQLHKLGLD